MIDESIKFNKTCSRREFFERAGAFVGLMTLGVDQWGCQNNSNTGTKKIKIANIGLAVEREPLIRPFGFKGGHITQLWQVAALVGNESRESFIGLGTQSVLWSDAQVFSSHSESEGNELMLAITERALDIVLGTSYSDPIHLIDTIMEEVYDYGKKITKNDRLRKTFILNALVAFDNAAWLLYANENGISTFDHLIPKKYKPALSYRHTKLASIPLITYGVPIDEVTEAADQGYLFMKIKIGQPGTQEEMLEKDKIRIEAIHRAIGHIETPMTADGIIPYYFDANGRYEKKETLLKLLDYLMKIGAYDRIAILEEPFPEESDEEVHDLGLRIAADESAHTDEDAIRRIQMGYQAIALKPIAKTLSMSLKIAKVAHENNVPCFCADLTVNPILVDWNKNVAARLQPIPELGIGVLETNGHQNYKNWNKLVNYHPCAGSSWMDVKNGIFHLNDDFYQKSGGIFLPSQHYYDLVKIKN
jgi:L-alanine-DL-glutamate epimerase-like enolase superfamily enzyme